MLLINLIQGKKSSGTINKVSKLIMPCNYAYVYKIYFVSYNHLPLASKHQEARTIRTTSKQALKSWVLLTSWNKDKTCHDLPQALCLSEHPGTYKNIPKILEGEAINSVMWIFIATLGSKMKQFPIITSEMMKRWCLDGIRVGKKAKVVFLLLVGFFWVCFFDFQ